MVFMQQHGIERYQLDDEAYAEVQQATKREIKLNKNVAETGFVNNTMIRGENGDGVKYL